MKCFSIKGKLSIHTEGVSLRWGTEECKLWRMLLHFFAYKSSKHFANATAVFSLAFTTYTSPNLIAPADAQAKNKIQPLCN